MEMPATVLVESGARVPPLRLLPLPPTLRANFAGGGEGGRVTVELAAAAAVTADKTQESPVRDKYMYFFFCGRLGTAT